MPEKPAVAESGKADKGEEDGGAKTGQKEGEETTSVAAGKEAEGTTKAT